MIVNTLHDISGHLNIKKGDRKIHQFDEEIGYERNIDPGTQVQ